MHEMAITRSILDISLRYGEEAQATRITDIHIVIGQLSSFVDESIQMYWDMISEGTIAEGATLHFRRLPAMVRCPACSAVYELDMFDFVCPECGSEQGEIKSGDELYVESIQVVEGEHHDPAEYSRS